MDRIDARVPMNHGGSIPLLGLGTWQLHGREAREAVRHALEVGYRHIDTASMYGNEKEVAEGIRASGVPREDVFVTTKVWNDEQGYESTLKACAASLKRLGSSYVDLYLIHWPVPGERGETWRAMQRLLKDGKARAIGVSNYMVQHLAEFDDAKVKPAVNQIELHPWLQPRDAIAKSEKMGIIVEAYSPLARGRRMKDATVGGIAKKRGKTVAQVLVRWGLQHGYVSIPKSGDPARIEENADVFDFSLTAAEMRTLDALHEKLHVTWDPTDEP
ncbi:MAG TPA: aldo/keto reductase [Thermoplasmata archaeon]|nr:aldo/keto reductase [Thermoplasmata archaeon]